MTSSKLQNILQEILGFKKIRHGGFVYGSQQRLRRRIKYGIRIRSRKKVCSATSTPTQYLLQKEKTRALVQERISHFIDQYKKYGIDLRPSGRIAIRDSRSRWGSCSSKGNLNFHWKLGIIPQHLSDYVIVHELCHLKEFNHGKQFWELVELVCPEYRDCKAELRMIYLV